MTGQSFRVARKRLKEAMSAALRQYSHVMMEDFSPVPDLVVKDSPEFCALVEPSGDSYRIVVATGVVNSIEALWLEASKNPELLDVEGRSGAYDINGLVNISLIWLILHELMHIRLEHFRFTGGACLVESASSRKFGLVKFPQTSCPDMDFFDDDEKPLVKPCLELQADNEAIDTLLGVYARDRWEHLIYRAASIFAVMVLIEKNDQEHNGGNGSYPMAATRLFIMLAHLFQMWIFPYARLEKDEAGVRMKTDNKLNIDEFQEYSDTVISPSVKNAIILSSAARVNIIGEKAPQGDAILHDLLTAQDHKELVSDVLQSDAAREWLRLMPVNDKILDLTGLRKC